LEMFTARSFGPCWLTVEGTFTALVRLAAFAFEAPLGLSADPSRP
jgi:hypothetical protein